MELALMVSGFFLAVVAVSSIVFLQRHDRIAFLQEAAQYGWRASEMDGEEVLRRWSGLTLFDVGHSRRVERVLEREGPAYLFVFSCETGFEHRRRLHRWVVVASAMSRPTSPAMISRQGWLLAAARLPGRRSITVGPPHEGSAALVAVVEDDASWRGELVGDAGRNLAAQPTTRNWEFLNGFVFVYEAGSLTGENYHRVLDMLNKVRSLWSPPAAGGIQNAEFGMRNSECRMEHAE